MVGAAVRAGVVPLQLTPCRSAQHRLKLLHGRGRWFEYTRAYQYFLFLVSRAALHFSSFRSAGDNVRVAVQQTVVQQMPK